MKYRVSREALKAGYRSGLEMKVADELTAQGVDFEYEAHPLHYIVPQKKSRYTIDFLLPNGILIETKGRFVTSDRQKHKLVKEQFPDLDLRIVFTNPNSKIGKRSKTTYGMWCEKIGIPYATKWIPQEWVRARLNQKRLRAIKEALGYVPEILSRDKK